jgi:hypothetical protein
MDEQERDYLWQNIRQLERSKLRWKLATISMAAALAIFLIVGGVSSYLMGTRQLQQTRMMLEVERARAAEAEERVQAEKTRQLEGRSLKEKTSKKEGGGAALNQEQPNGDVGPKD